MPSAVPPAEPSAVPRRPPTLEDVAARAGVSRALVSIVMRDAPGASAATRERVRAVADELGYRPDGRARLLAGRRTRLLGVTLSLNNPFHAEVAEQIHTCAEARGYQVVLGAITETRRPRAALDALLSYRCEAIVLLGLPGRGVLGGSAGLAGRQPVVLVGQPSRHPGVDTVRGADAEGLRLAVEHLAGLGHRRIVHVDGGDAVATAARRAGYRAAMRRYGLATGASVLAGGDTEEAGAAAARALVDGSAGLPDAVITYNDRSAIGLLDVFARLGVGVPDAVSVVGYDDTRAARLPYFALTTVAQDTGRLAELAVERAVDRIEGHEVGAREIVLDPHLVVRGTTAPAAGRA